MKKPNAKPQRKPRDVRGAIRQGWHLASVTINQRVKHDVSHLGLDIWCTVNAKGDYRVKYESDSSSTFAFQLEEDCTWFSLKWH